CCRLDKAHHHVEYRGFARTIGTEETHDFAALHGESDFADRHFSAIALCKPLQKKGPVTAHRKTLSSWEAGNWRQGNWLMPNRAPGRRAVQNQARVPQGPLIRRQVRR